LLNKRVKEATGIKNLRELSERVGISPSRLDYMFNNHPLEFDLLLYEAALDKIRESLEINEEEMK